ncbi:hypothetical protein FOMPIDRAFT_1055179 [Fomitopsis schrenkii]|uniref:Uncharacterized protein n=1 Tax=Fomitopsis schrenkii TaxID=2126942 RepID=S8DNW4_FOMSC|nr:hypothetical protein FOMPIDRAFT_1055179 [Fomitopsis schrenkii]
MDSWQGLVTALHKILSHLSSPVIRTLQLRIRLEPPEHSPSTSTHPDSEFWTLDLGSIHDVIKRPLFNSLRDASIKIWSEALSLTRLTCDAVLTAEEKARRVCLILEPWDKRGILAVEGYHEFSDEEIERERARWRNAYDSEQQGFGEGVGEEAQSSEDATVVASDQANEAGFEGTVQDLVGNSDG